MWTKTCPRRTTWHFEHADPLPVGYQHTLQSGTPTSGHGSGPYCDSRRGNRLHQHGGRRGTSIRRSRAGSKKLVGRVDLILSALEVLPLEAPADRHYRDLRHHLARQGTLIGPNDLLIAAHALSENLTVVTANAGEFSSVPGLKVENWLEK